MIQVKLELAHEGEVHLFQQFVGFLRTARKDWEKMGGFDAEPPKTGDLGAADAPAPGLNETVIASPTGEFVKASDGNEVGITNEDLEKVLTEYSQRHGIPAAVELLAKFGAQRLTDVATKDRSRFYAQASA